MRRTHTQAEFTHRQLLPLDHAVFHVTIGDQLGAGAARIFQAGFVAIAGGHVAARVAAQRCAERAEKTRIRRGRMQTFTQLRFFLLVVDVGARGTSKLKSVLPFDGWMEQASAAKQRAQTMWNSIGIDTAAVGDVFTISN